MDTKILEELGLTNNEVKIYLTLLELGASSAGAILEKSKLPSSTVHRNLNSLIEKSILSHITENGKRIYQATNPEHFFDFIEEKKKRFEKILPELKSKQNTNNKKETASIYKGIQGIKKVYEIMRNTKAKEYLTYGGGPPTEKIMGLTWWLNHHQKRIANKLPSRQIFDLSVKNIGGTDIEKLPKTSIRYVSGDLAQFQETVIVGERVAIAVFTETPYAFLIEDEAVAEGYKKYFEILWKQSTT